jgi:hypothetical protein
MASIEREFFEQELALKQAEIDRLKAAGRRVVRCHDVGTLSKAPGDSISIEALRDLVKE